MDLPVNEIEFSSDTAHRKQWFRGCSFSHPAKMHLSLQMYLIEHYTNPGDTILDPMTGSGTILVACAIGRNIICVELEQKFVDMQQANWQKIKALGPILGYTMGEATILQGDARNLEGLLADSCIFSPPYAETLQGSGADAARKRIAAGKYKGKRPDVWTSKGNVAGSTFGDGYGISDGQISNLPYGEVSAVISSPPYEASIKKGDGVIGETDDFYKGVDHKTRLAKRKTGEYAYSGDDSNIGNLKSDNYLQAMLLVYQQCHRVLRDGGLMILVTKNFIRNKQIVRLDTDTIQLCETAGFTLKERLKRKLTQQSFWRIIYYKKYPDAPKIEFEDVLVFEKRTV